MPRTDVHSFGVLIITSCRHPEAYSNIIKRLAALINENEERSFLAQPTLHIILRRRRGGFGGGWPPPIKEANTKTLEAVPLRRRPFWTAGRIKRACSPGRRSL